MISDAERLIPVAAALVRTVPPSFAEISSAYFAQTKA
jgi:hypothetical protein